MHFRALEQDPDCPDALDVFLDLTELDSIPEPTRFQRSSVR
jgi:hypothetical protein